MKVPQSGRKKALFIVDLQPAFVRPESAAAITNIQKLIQSMPYDLYVASLFYSDANSMWVKQTDDKLVSRDKDFHTLPEVAVLLKDKPLVEVEKQTKSVFKGNQDLVSILGKHDIQEIHLVGYDTDDCILVTANEAFDLGFFSYVIEECAASSSGPALHEHALALLRNVKMTNHACVEHVEFKDI